MLILDCLDVLVSGRRVLIVQPSCMEHDQLQPQLKIMPEQEQRGDTFKCFHQSVCGHTLSQDLSRVVIAVGIKSEDLELWPRNNETRSDDRFATSEYGNSPSDITFSSIISLRPALCLQHMAVSLNNQQSQGSLDNRDNRGTLGSRDSHDTDDC